MKSATAGNTPGLNDVKARISFDHQHIRNLVEEVARTAASVLALPEPTGVGRRLIEPICRLFLVLDEHLAFEEMTLVPLLLATGAWGTIRARQLREEHHAQRSMLLAMTSECDGETKTVGELVEDARWLVQSLRADMAREDAELDAIRDDGFVVDQSTG